MSEARQQLQPVDEDWERALVVVAHPDDMEYGGAAAVARWTAQGKSVRYTLVTSGEAGIDAAAPQESRPLREDEQRASCAEVGVEDVVFLGLPDGVLEYGLELRAAIAAQIRAYRPQIVITNNFREAWPGGVLNQADHIATGRATVDAARDAGNRWVFADQLKDQGLTPWNGVRQVWAASSPRSEHAADISHCLDAGIASLRAHAAYIEGLGTPDFDPARFLSEMAAADGKRLGTTYATPFEVLTL